MSNINCKKYVQLSSMAVYMPNDQGIIATKEKLKPSKVKLELDTKEAFFNLNKIQVEFGDENAFGYNKCKLMAEAVTARNYQQFKPVMVRLPYITRTDRLYYFCECIQKGIAMKIFNLDKQMPFAREIDVARFLPWIAAQDFTGSVNLSSEGTVSIREILTYIEEKLGKKAIIDLENGVDVPFYVYNEQSFSLNLDLVKKLGHEPPQLKNWFWQLMDEYIEYARNNA